MRKLNFTRIIKRSLPVLAAIALLGSVFTLRSYADGELTGKTAEEIVAMMNKGWNMGNTLDARDGNSSDIYSQETSWGNPRINREMIHGVKEAGFDTIRIPITWYKFIDKSNGYAINPDFMAHVKEVVDWALEEDLFVIINVHHESWVNRTDIDKSYKEIGEELSAVWSQISDEFADYDQKLIFEGMNEPRAGGADYEWQGNPACYEAVNYLDQVFVDTVRGNGKGHNGERVLMVPGYAASSSQLVLNSIKLPQINGETASNIALSVHCYSPYEFCLTDQKNTFDPNNASDNSDIKRLMSSLEISFISKGIPVIIGECGCTNSGNNNAEREKWFAFMGEQTAKKGIPAIVWDNGANKTSGGECHSYIDRKTGEMVSPELIAAFLSGKYAEPLAAAEDVTYDFEPFDNGSGKLTPMSPDIAGFITKKLANQSKVNHTEGAVVGFSLKVTTYTDKTAAMDISRFAGKNLKITAWVSSKDTDTVTMSLTNNSADYITVNTTSDWQELTIYAAIGDGETLLEFKGDEDTEFYIDDITLTMVDSLEVVSDGKDSNVDSKNGNSGNGSDEPGNGYVTEDGTPVTVINGKIVIIVMLSAIVGVAILGALAITIGKWKKRDKKKS